MAEMQPWINGEQIDREIAESEPCPQCGSKMEFRSERVAARVDNFGMRTPASYRAFAVCTNPECEEEVEF
ncbi:MAG: hypothetical protein L0226_14660 [Acidobacteria bacterium]|nr:hypothetical protein [Acidobacteriota bacterium]